ncbi:MAG: outer membrane lipoprotein carrier protein LolA [Desulfocapsaceae bacterium]|nr:outer membrane lipoprotein carrier protein LolA [Desulfocapsaceae bacterium]
MRSLVVVLFLAAGLGFLSPARAQDVAGQPPVRVDSVQAEFTQEKHLPILVRPIISRGTFVFQAPASLRWEYLSPVHSVLLMDDGRTRKFIERNDQFVEEQGMGMDSMAIVLQEITGWLDGHITDTPTFKAKVQEGGLIVLTPKEAALARIISRIELRLAGQSGLMESVTLYEGPDSLTKLIFSHGVLNEKIPAATFMKP